MRVVCGCCAQMALARGGAHLSASEGGRCERELQGVATRRRCRQAEMGELTSELMCGTSDGHVGYEARPAPTAASPGVAEHADGQSTAYSRAPVKWCTGAD